MLARLIIIAAAAAIGGGAILGRRAINKRIEENLPAEIEAARKQAIGELDKEIGQVISEKLSFFAVNMAVKAALVGAVYLFFASGYLSAAGLRILISILILAFVARDAVKTLPFVIPAWKHVSQHQWRFRQAFVEFVAGVAFERAYIRAMVAMETEPNRLWIALSKYTKQSISEEVGAAVANVARSISVEHAKKRAIIAAVLAVLMFIAYALFFWLTVGAAWGG